MDFLHFRSWERRRGSGHRQGGGHKIRDCSKIILYVQLGCKRPLHSAWCPSTSERVLPVLWQSTEGRILRPHASVPFITVCFCLLQHQWQPLELICYCLCRSLCRKEDGAILQLLSHERNVRKWTPHILHKLGKFMALLWYFHYSTESLPDYSTPAWWLESLERGTLMLLMYIHDPNVECWQGQRKITKCHN